MKCAKGSGIPRHEHLGAGEYYVIAPMLPELRVKPEPPARTTEYSSSETTLDRAQLDAMLAPYRTGEVVDA